MQTEKVREYYNDKVKNKFKSQYEYHRWFETDIKKAGYDMTHESVVRHALPITFNKYFELGPGAGTWTRLFVKKNPQGIFNLLDISSEMLKIAGDALEGGSDIDYIESDFLNFTPQKKYDLFFSSRVVEYIPEKSEVIEKINQILKNGGRGFIITKTPKYFRAKLLGRKTTSFHSGQIRPRELEKLLKQSGFVDIKMYPATFSLPILKSFYLNCLLFRVLSKFKLNPISQFFSESYCVIFKKP